MIEFNELEVIGWEHAIRGMRNPLNSWNKSDSKSCKELSCHECPLNDVGCLGVDFVIGNNDFALMKKLASAGTSHSKYRRMITVYVDITAPLYWWKEFDTYKVGTVANSCSTMHKIHSKEFTLDDFSHEHLFDGYDRNHDYYENPTTVLEYLIGVLNYYRKKFIDTKDKKYWWQMIQLLPTSYNQKRTVMLNYEVLANMYATRKDHKLDEWRELCELIKTLPYSELITGVDTKSKE